MHFGRPELFSLFWILPALIVFFWWAAKKKEAVRARFGSLELLGKMSSSVSPEKIRWKRILILAGVGTLLFTIAGPQYGSKLRKVRREGQDIIIALDVSSSMLAEDLKPNRMERAKQAISSMMELMEGDRVGLVLFAGRAFVECPLTLDYSAARMFLDVVDTDIIPVPGTAIGSAIRAATEAFVQKERKHKVLILMTDGEDHQSDPVEAAKEAAKEGVRIYTIGIGDPGGVPIPERDRSGRVTGHKRDRNGDVVITKLDEKTLQKVALLTDGGYYRSSLAETELHKIYADIQKMEKKKVSSREYSQYEERYQVFLLLAVILLAGEVFLDDRRKKKGAWTGRFA